MLKQMVNTHFVLLILFTICILMVDNTKKFNKAGKPEETVQKTDAVTVNLAKDNQALNTNLIQTETKPVEAEDFYDNIQLPKRFQNKIKSKLREKIKNYIFAELNNYFDEDNNEYNLNDHIPNFSNNAFVEVKSTKPKPIAKSNNINSLKNMSDQELIEIKKNIVREKYLRARSQN